MCVSVANWIFYQTHCDPNKEYVFISYFPKWQGIKFIRLGKDRSKHNMMWEWVFVFGFWQIAKWRPAHKMKLIFDEQHKEEYGEYPNYKMLWDFFFQLNQSPFDKYKASHEKAIK